MRSLGEYIVSVTAAAIVCAIVGGMMPKGTAKEILRLVGGLFLVFAVIRPAADLRLPDLSAMGEGYREDAALAAAEGENQALETVRLRIKQDLAAYILDKAGELGLELTVEVILEDSGYLPEAVRVSGDAAPEAKQEMLRYLTRELGIQEDQIQWTR